MNWAAYVLVPSGTEDVERIVEQLMAPYHDDWEVEEYEKECDCLWDNAWAKAKQAIQEESGSSETRGFRWDKRIAPIALQIHDRESHESLANSDCDECGGKGVCMTTFNPNARFDYFLVNHEKDTFHNAAKDPSKVSKGQAIVPVKDLDLERLEAPDTMITSSGEWYDRVYYEYTDNGIVEKVTEDWKDQVKAIVEEHIDEILVQVRYHT